MKDELRVGDYVRTYYGELAIIKEISPRIRVKKLNNKNITLLDFNSIKKYSENIIDLIEIGDVLKLKEDDSTFCIALENDKMNLTYKEIIEEIKSNKIELLEIATKEQFKNISYEV